MLSNIIQKKAIKNQNSIANFKRQNNWAYINKSTQGFNQCVVPFDFIWPNKSC